MAPASPRSLRLLLFAFEGIPSDALAELMSDAAHELSTARAWQLGAPRFVDEVDEDSCTAPGDKPIRTVGVFVNVSPPPGARSDTGGVKLIHSAA